MSALACELPIHHSGSGPDRAASRMSVFGLAVRSRPSASHPKLSSRCISFRNRPERALRRLGAACAWSPHSIAQAREICAGGHRQMVLLRSSASDRPRERVLAALPTDRWETPRRRARANPTNDDSMIVARQNSVTSQSKAAREFSRTGVSVSMVVHWFPAFRMFLPTRGNGADAVDPLLAGNNGRVRVPLTLEGHR